MMAGSGDTDPTMEDTENLFASPRVSGEGAPTPEQMPVGVAVRATVQELLKYGLLEAADKPNLYRNAAQYREKIGEVLGWLDLALRIDEVRGLAFVVVAAVPNADQDEWTHPLVRRQRLTLEQTLLVAILRQQFVAHEVEAGVGVGDSRVALEDLVPQLQVFFGDLGSDTQERKRLLTLLEQLKGHGIVSDVDQQERVTIRPIIVHLANPENLTNLVQALRKMAGNGEIETSEGADE